MNIDKTIAELELKHLIESLLELDIKDKRLTPSGMNSYDNDPVILKDWSNKNFGKFMKLLDCLGIDDLSFCCIPLWTKWANAAKAKEYEEMPVDTVYCFKLENGMTFLSELKLDKNEEFTILKLIENSGITDSPKAFFKMLHIALNENLMLNRPKALEQYPFMKKMMSMFSNR